METAQSYTCPNCGGPLHFDSKIGKLKCDYCDSVFTIEEAKKYYEEKNKKNEESGEQASQTAAQQDETTQAPPHMRFYSCTSCGAQLMCDETTVATTCPYCGNPTVMASGFSNVRKPDYCIPFRFEQKEAVEALKGYYKNKYLLPKTFVTDNQVQKITGVYVPFWLFSGSVDADMSFHGTRTSTRREGDYEVTRTQHYDVRRAGTVTFEKIPCDASKKMPDDLMDSVEPYDYKALTAFQYEYLPGYLANRYDVSIEDCAPRADERATNSAAQAMRNTVTGYSTVQETGRRMNVHREKVDYAMMPVYILHTHWNNQDFLFAMNGQTRKMTGDLPVSAGRAAAWFAGICGGFLAVFLLILYAASGTLNSTSVLISLLISLVIAGCTVGAMASSMKPVKRSSQAGHYVDNTRSRLQVRQDLYTHTTESRVRVQQSGGGGGRGPGGPGGYGGYGGPHGGPGGPGGPHGQRR